MDQRTRCTTWLTEQPKNPASIDDGNKMRRGADAVNGIEVIEPGSEMNQALLHGFVVRAYDIAWIGREMQARQ